jgi:phage terminase large subunit
LAQREIVIPYLPRAAFRTYHARTERWAVNVCHRRAGKTVAAVNDLQREVLRSTLQDPRAYYLAPTYAQAKKTAWDYAKRYAEPLPGVKINETELRIDYPNLGGDNPDSLRGIYADAVVLDEFAFMDPTVWSQIIRPALSDRRGRATFISSVNGRNDFCKLYETHRDDPEWFTMNLKASASGLIDPDELAALKADMTDDEYRQEYENDFSVAAKGAYYGKAMQEADDEGRIGHAPYDPGRECVTAWDLGIGDSTAIWIAQVVGQQIRVIDYIEASGVGLEYYAKALREKPYLYREHFLPHDAEAKELGTGLSRVETLRSLGIRQQRVVSNVAVDDGINAVRRLLPRMWFDAKKCEKGIEALRQYRKDWDEKTQAFRQRPRHDWASHASDSMRYLALGLGEAGMAEKVRVKDRYRKPVNKGSAWTV